MKKYKQLINSMFIKVFLLWSAYSYIAPVSASITYELIDVNNTQHSNIVNQFKALGIQSDQGKSFIRVWLNNFCYGEYGSGANAGRGNDKSGETLRRTVYVNSLETDPKEIVEKLVKNGSLDDDFFSNFNMLAVVNNCVTQSCENEISKLMNLVNTIQEEAKKLTEDHGLFNEAMLRMEEKRNTKNKKSKKQQPPLPSISQTEITDQRQTEILRNELDGLMNFVQAVQTSKRESLKKAYKKYATARKKFDVQSSYQMIVKASPIDGGSSSDNSSISRVIDQQLNRLDTQQATRLGNGIEILTGYRRFLVDVTQRVASSFGLEANMTDKGNARDFKKEIFNAFSVECLRHAEDAFIQDLLSKITTDYFVDYQSQQQEIVIVGNLDSCGMCQLKLQWLANKLKVDIYYYSKTPYQNAPCMCNHHSCLANHEVQWQQRSGQFQQRWQNWEQWLKEESELDIPEESKENYPWKTRPNTPPEEEKKEMYARFIFKPDDVQSSSTFHSFEEKN